jgi:hypothetical protein
MLPYSSSPRHSIPHNVEERAFDIFLGLCSHPRILSMGGEALGMMGVPPRRLARKMVSTRYVVWKVVTRPRVSAELALWIYVFSLWETLILTGST